ncbi:response regulator [Melioribacteraceae bacterium 4301-Me]|uniref:hybrid sensor histidine kinase/response regulator n=1 Tax=Pyranulibacter aquaticus TaxID=3163344 RepID=UPI00359B5193
METNDQKFLKKLLSTFKEEAAEHINVITKGLIELEKNPSEERANKIIETIYREAHSLKGAARSVNISEIEMICGSLESVFNAVKKKEIPLSSDIFDTLYITTDFITKLIITIDLSLSSSEKNSISNQALKLQKILDEISTKSQEKKEKIKNKSITSSDTTLSSEQYGSSIERPSESYPKDSQMTLLDNQIKVSTQKLDDILLQAEELLSTKLSFIEHINKLKSIQEIFIDWKKEQGKIQNAIQSLSKKMEFYETTSKFIDVNNSIVEKTIQLVKLSSNFINKIEHELNAALRTTKQEEHSFGIKVDSLLYDLKRVLMQPVSSILNVFQRFVRDTAKDQKKKVNLFITGSEIEVDKRILEELKVPIMHLIRNCIDHGIEKPSVRIKNGKPEEGEIKIEISQKNSNKVEIKISDDGKGIDLREVIDSAVKSGIIKDEEKDKLTTEQTLALIFYSGITTSQAVTDLSGRGLGLAIAREKIENIGGSLSVSSEINKGTTFIIELPVMLTNFHGVFVSVGENKFVIPSLYIKQVTRIKKEEIKTIGNRETIKISNQVIPLLKLSDVLGISNSNGTMEKNGYLQIVVLCDSNNCIAYLVDEILTEQELLVKPLPEQYSQIKKVSAVTITGGGKVVPILNVSEVIKSSVSQPSPIVSEFVETKEAKKKKSILIAEDSITTRTLLQNMLETAGYEVTTAIDGIDAYSKLISGNFNLVISDVDMPRMNGFELARKIKSEKKLSEIPVILLTALDSEESLKQGMEVGADAYIVKSKFDQANLLEIVNQLI